MHTSEEYTYQLFPASGRTTVQATHAFTGEVVGSAFIYGNILKSVWVDPDHRRKGVATGMMRFIDYKVSLDDSAEMSVEGALWSSFISTKLL